MILALSTDWEWMMNKNCHEIASFCVRKIFFALHDDDEGRNEIKNVADGNSRLFQNKNKKKRRKGEKVWKAIFHNFSD